MTADRQNTVSRRPSSVVSQIETVFMRHTVGQQPQALGKGGMVALYLINTFNNMDLTANNVNVMLGGENGQPEEILPGAVSSLVYARDLENVYARAANPSPVVLALGADVSLRGTYTFRGLHNGLPFYSLDGEADNPVVSAISFDGAHWVVYDAAGVATYTSADAPVLPALANWAGSGTAQVITNVIDPTTDITIPGDCAATISAAGFNGGVPLVVTFAVNFGDGATDVAAACAIALNANAIFAAFFQASDAGSDVNVIFNTIAANDPTASLLMDETPPTTKLPASESTITTPGVANAELTTIDGVDVTLKVYRKLVDDGRR